MTNQEILSLFSTQAAQKSFRFRPTVRKAAKEDWFYGGKSYADISGTKCEMNKELNYLLAANEKALSGDYDACAFMGYFFLTISEQLESYSTSYLSPGSEAKHPACLHLFALYCRQKGFDSLAIRLLKDLLDQGEAMGAEPLVTALIERKRLDEAIDCLKKWLALSPKDKKASAYLGKVYMELGRYEEAYLLFREHEESFHYPLGKLLYDGLGVAQDQQQALLHFRKAVSCRQPPEYVIIEDASLIKLAQAYYSGRLVPKSIARGDGYIDLFCTPDGRFWRDMANDKSLFPEFRDYSARRKDRIEAFLKAGEQDPHNYLKAARLLRNKNMRKDAYAKASKAGLDEATCILAHQFSEISRMDPAKTSGLKNATYEIADIIKSSRKRRAGEPDLPNDANRRIDEFIMSLSDDNVLAYFHHLFFLSSSRRLEASFPRLARLALRMPMDELRERLYGEESRFIMPKELLAEEEGRELYQRLVLLDYGLFRDKRLDKLYGVDPEQLLEEDLFGKQGGN